MDNLIASIPHNRYPFRCYVASSPLHDFYNDVLRIIVRQYTAGDLLIIMELFGPLVRHGYA